MPARPGRARNFSPPRGSPPGTRTRRRLFVARDCSKDERRSRSRIGDPQAGSSALPRNVDMLYLLGHAYEALGRQVIDQLEKANPHSSYVEQWLGEDYANSGYLAAGLLHFEKAISVEPKRSELHVAAGEVYLAASN